MSTQFLIGISMRATTVCAAAAMWLTACAASGTSPGQCTFVATEDLARPRDAAGQVMICDPRRVSPAQRERYFPGYQWGDETWTAAKR